MTITEHEKQDAPSEDDGGGVSEENSKDDIVVDDYGYEDTEKDRAAHPTVPSNRTIARRNVVTVEESAFELSYHPGRVVGLK